jgi:hypothetical protein
MAGAKFDQSEALDGVVINALISFQKLSDPS